MSVKLVVELVELLVFVKLVVLVKFVELVELTVIFKLVMLVEYRVARVG